MVSQTQMDITRGAELAELQATRSFVQNEEVSGWLIATGERNLPQRPS